MYDKLDRALNKTRSRLIDVCHELDIDINDVNVDELLNAPCCNCDIWGNKFTELVEDEGLLLCKFCFDIDSLRF
jgi:hypothetical protein